MCKPKGTDVLITVAITVSLVIIDYILGKRKKEPCDDKLSKSDN